MIALFIRPARLAMAALIFYWTALFIGTHLPRLSMDLDLPRSSDKALHFVAYAGLAFLLALCICKRQRPTLANCLTVLIIATVYGAVDELIQWPIPGRNADIFDWVADVLGAIAGWTMFFVVQPAFRRSDHDRVGGIKAVCETL